MFDVSVTGKYDLQVVFLKLEGLEKELLEEILKTFWSCYLISGKNQETSFIQKYILLGTVSPTLKVP